MNLSMILLILILLAVGPIYYIVVTSPTFPTRDTNQQAVDSVVCCTDRSAAVDALVSR